MTVHAPPEVVTALGLDLDPDRPERLWAKDQWMVFAVYRVRTESLRLNPANRRFRAERVDIERQLGRTLDPATGEADTDALMVLALDKEPRIDERDRVVGSRNPESEALAADWRTRRQEAPFWIRPDGLIVNGNRRWAVLRRLQRDQGLQGFDYVDVIVLGDEFETPDLFQMEAREQLTEGLKVRYGDVNLLLTLHEAATLEGVDWNDPNDIRRAARAIRALVGDSEAYAFLQLTAVKYMADYLEEIGAPDDFRHMEGRVERFRDVARNMTAVRTQDPGREAKMLELCFAAIRSRNPHDDLREFRRMLTDQADLFDELYLQVVTALDAVGDIQAEPEVSRPRDTDDDDDPDANEAGPAAYLPVHELISVQVQAAKTSRESATKSVRLASALLARVPAEALAEALAQPDDEVAHNATQAIVAWADDARALLGDSIE